MVYVIYSAKGVFLGRVSVVQMQGSPDIICVVEWNSGEKMFFVGPAMIIFPTSRYSSLIIEFTGEDVVMTPMIKRSLMDYVPHCNIVLCKAHLASFRLHSHVVGKISKVFGKLSAVTNDGHPVIHWQGSDHTRLEHWDSLIGLAHL